MHLGLDTVCMLLPGLLLLTKQMLGKFSVGLVNLFLFFKNYGALRGEEKGGQHRFSVKDNSKYIRF